MDDQILMTLILTITISALLALLFKLCYSSKCYEIVIDK